LSFGFRLDFGFRVLGDVTRILRLYYIYYIVLVTRPIQPIGFSEWQNNSSNAFSCKGKVDTILLNFLKF